MGLLLVTIPQLPLCANWTERWELVFVSPHRLQVHPGLA
jgi:hypothetical protein